MSDSQDLSPPFAVLGQYLRDLSFENLFSINRSQNDKLEGTLKSSVEHEVNCSTISEQERLYEVELVVTSTATEEDTKLFIVEIKYVAIVQISPAVDIEHFETILKIEIPYYLYFQVSNLAAHMTYLGGYPPMFLRPIDFASSMDFDDEDGEEEDEDHVTIQ